MAEEPEEREGEGDNAAEEARRWVAELAVSEKSQAKWVGRVKKISKRYAADLAASDTNRRFSMLWSNTQTITPALYARPPQPVVSRRFKDEDPVGRVASEVLERALSFSVDKQDLDGVLRLCAQDFALIARAQVWERYVPTHGAAVTPKVPVVQVGNGPDEELYEDDEGKSYAPGQVQGEGEDRYVDGEPYEPIVFEASVTDFVNWEDFGFGPARSWDEVPYVWRKVYLTRAELKARFGDEIGSKVPLDWSDSEKDETQRELTGKAVVYEIWDKCSRHAFWISKGYAAGPLDKREDPLGLDGFFPCPRPLFGTLPPGKLSPVPDFMYYQDQADEIDSLTNKIAELEKALKVRGFYAGQIAEDLNSLMSVSNNTLIPVASWQAMEEGGGLRKQIEWWPIDMVVQALKACIDLRRQLIDDVYQITGVSDIQRGASDPRETASAQNIKATFGSLRIRDRQNEIVRFARDILRIKGEVIAEHFGPETLAAITGMKLPTAADKAAAQVELQRMQLLAQQQPQQGLPGAQGAAPPPPPPQVPPEVQKMLDTPSWEDVVGLLRDNAMRGFRIDIETDSTIEPNESEEKARMVEFVTAIGGFFNQIGPIIEKAPASAPMFAEIVKSAVRRFRAGREVEAAIERTMDQVSSAQGGAPAAPAPPPPDKTPVEVAQLNLERERTKAAAQVQTAQIEAQSAAGDQQLKARDQDIKTQLAPYDATPQVQAQ